MIDGVNFFFIGDAYFATVLERWLQERRKLGGLEIAELPSQVTGEKLLYELLEEL